MLKKPSADQKGLKKLPTNVRNKMGYMNEGGMMMKKEDTKGMGYKKGGMTKKAKGYAKGGMVGASNPPTQKRTPKK